MRVTKLRSSVSLNSVNIQWESTSQLEGHASSLEGYIIRYRVSIGGDWVNTFTSNPEYTFVDLELADVITFRVAAKASCGTVGTAKEIVIPLGES